MLTLERSSVSDSPGDHHRAGRGRHGPEAPRGSRRWWPGVTAVVVVLALVTLALPAGRHQWALSFVRQPTPYTTLSFQHAAQLPTTVSAGGSIHLAFTVANQEGRRLRYAYVVTSTGPHNGRSVLHRGVLTVPAGGQRSTSISVAPVCSAAPCHVEVSLPGHPETIDVLLHAVTAVPAVPAG